MERENLNLKQFARVGKVFTKQISETIEGKLNNENFVLVPLSNLLDN
ncbi:hypothetical protein [Aureibaculum luteum]|nr:hypothetical protein [Aureibaculum luteum]